MTKIIKGFISSYNMGSGGKARDGLFSNFNKAHEGAGKVLSFCSAEEGILGIMICFFIFVFSWSQIICSSSKMLLTQQYLKMGENDSLSLF